MEKEEIVKRFFENGFLLPPDMLEKINEKNINELLEKIKKSDPEKVIISEIPSDEIKTPIKTIVTVKKTRIKNKLSPEDFIKYYNNKYNGIKNILLKKSTNSDNSPVSINKLGTVSNALIIGMVRELTPRGFILEDTTGSIECIGKETASIDDVIAIRGFSRENKILANEILYPDIPLNHEINKIKNTEILLTEKIPASMPKSDFIFTFNLSNSEISAENSQIINLTLNPSWVTVSRRKNKLNILVYKPPEDTEIKQAIDYLKKRHLSPDRKHIQGPDDYFLIEPIPDIFWLIMNKKDIETYKGVTIVSCGQSAYAKINLETREVEFKEV